MIQIRSVHEVPDGFGLYLDEHSRKHWDAIAPDIRRQRCRRSKRIWIVSCDGEPVFVIGLREKSFAGSSAEIWFLTCKGLHRHVKESCYFLRRAMRRTLLFYGGLMVQVDHGFARGHRFVKFFGFEYKYQVPSIYGQPYDIYELRHG